MIKSASQKLSTIYKRPCSELNFLNRMQLGVIANQTSEAGFFMWGANVLKYNGTYYYFGNKWADTDGFNGWVYYNKIYRTSNASLLGNFNSGQVELSALRNQSWSADMVTNPNIIKWTDGKYYLFYTGTWYSSITYPVLNSQARANQQIGVAVADSPDGTFTPYSGNPILSPRPGKWDQTMVNNPSVYTDINGTLRMIYKSDLNGTLGELRLGVATASSPLGPWGGRTDQPNFNLTGTAEDPFAWQENGKWYAIAKAMDNSIVNIGEGIFLTSADGITWAVSQNPLAYSLMINWTNSSGNLYDKVERPSIVIENGVGVALFNSVYDGTNSFNIGRSISPIIPCS